MNHNKRLGIFIFKFDPTGQTLLFSTFVGGSDLDVAMAIQPGADGVYFAGSTNSLDFPHVGAYSTSTYSFAFQPTTTGPLSGTYTITDNAGGTAGATETISFTGTGTPTTYTATFLPATTALGTIPVGQGTSTNLVLTNTGSGNIITITGVQFSDTNVQTTATNNLCPGVLVAGASCTIVVPLTPAAVGAFSGTVTVTDTDGTQTAIISGTATYLTITPSPSFDYGSVSLGSTVTQTFELKNVGTTGIATPTVQVTGTGFT